VRKLYFIATVISVILIVLALAGWSLLDYHMLRWVVWGTAVLGIYIFTKYRLSKRTSIWILLLLITGIIYSPIFPSLKPGGIGINRILAAILLLLSGIRSLIGDEVVGEE
jgi:hypothetical protein